MGGVSAGKKSLMSFGSLMAIQGEVAKHGGSIAGLLEPQTMRGDLKYIYAPTDQVQVLPTQFQQIIDQPSKNPMI